MSSVKIFWMYLKIHVFYSSSVFRTHWSINLNIKWHFIYMSCNIRKSQDKFSPSSWPFNIRCTSASTGFQAFELRWELMLVSCLVCVVCVAAFVTSWLVVQRSLNSTKVRIRRARHDFGCYTTKIRNFYCVI